MNEKANFGTDFGSALALLRRGASVYRVGWNAPHVLTLQRPDENSKMTLPYIYMTVGTKGDYFGARVPWIASQTDILADDWYELPVANGAVGLLRTHMTNTCISSKLDSKNSTSFIARRG